MVVVSCRFGQQYTVKNLLHEKGLINTVQDFTHMQQIYYIVSI